MEYSTVGKLVAVDAWGVSFDRLDDAKRLEKDLVDAAEKCGAKVLRSQSCHFKPYGVTVFVLLAESHISIHTYPEKGFAAIDCFTCGDSVDPSEATQYVIDQLQPSHFHSKVLHRGRGKISVTEGSFQND